MQPRHSSSGSPGKGYVYLQVICLRVQSRLIKPIDHSLISDLLMFKNARHEMLSSSYCQDCQECKHVEGCQIDSKYSTRTR